ncbi:MAG: NAD-dependent succinate-semialdehyde dehydrogenase, partial [Geodermatophilaceae bacterium]|nr:NAD-dependent succinate-semialdehyde dehydrogenase [Geodermatophilaceae bacterium]
TGVFIAGHWREATGGGTFTVADPGTGKPLTRVADGQAEDAVAALDAAVGAQESWAGTPARERGEILRRAWQLMVDRADDLALLMTLEMGKSLAESRAEVTYAAEFFRWFGEEAVRIEGRWATNPAGGSRLLTMKQPVGPCLLITPWNFPLAMGTRKIGPAIAAGCTMVVKPAQLTPLSMLVLTDLLTEAGLPSGVLNIVPSASAGKTVAPLMSDSRLRKVSFTGSTPVGRKLMAQASANLLRVSMELGGNAPFLVFADADLEAAVEGAVVAKMRNNGESCVAANRFHVAESVAEEFTDRLTVRMAELKLGHGAEDGTDVGPLIDDDQRTIVVDLVADAVTKGATVRTGGITPEGDGFYYPPTVLSDVPADARILREEVFGPVAPVTTFGSEAQALALANGTEFGLVAYVFTDDLRRAIRVAEGLQTGMVGLNTGLVSNASAPFGGVKSSGFGREGGNEGIEEYLSLKYVSLSMG